MYKRAYAPRSSRAAAPRRRSTFNFGVSTPFGVGLNASYSSKRKNSHLRSGASSSRAVRPGVRKITAPVAVGTSTQRISPKIAANSTGQLCFKNREAIAQLQVTDALAVFETHSYTINPGLPIFPLASNLARCFQRYNMRCKFFFETTQPSSSQGQSLIIVNRNVQDPIPATFPEFSSFMGCVTNPIWTNVECPGKGWIEMNDKYLYTRDAPIPDSGDSLMYDFCSISIAFSNLSLNNSTGVNIGTLWCEYEICFDGPKLTQSITTSTFTTSDNFLTDDLVNLPEVPAGDPGTAFASVNFITGTSAATYVNNVVSSSNNVYTPGEVSGIVFSQPGYYQISVDAGIEQSNATVYGFDFWEPFEDADGDSSTLVSANRIFMSSTSRFTNTTYINVAEPASVDEIGNIVGLGAVIHNNANSNEPPGTPGDPYIGSLMITVNPVDQQTINLLGLDDIGGGPFVQPVSFASDHRIHGSRKNLIKRNKMVREKKAAKDLLAKQAVTDALASSSSPCCKEEEYVMVPSSALKNVRC